MLKQFPLKFDQNNLNQTALSFAALAVGVGGAIGLLIAGIDRPIVLLLAAAGIPAILLTVAQAELGLIFLVFMTYSRLSDALKHYNGLPSIAQPFMVLMIGIIALRWFVYKEKPKRISQALVLFSLYGIFTFSSMLYARDFGDAFGAFENYVKDVIIAMIVIVLLKRSVTLRYVVWGLLAAGILMGTISTYQYLTGTYANTYWGFGLAEIQNITTGADDYRIAGSVGDPNFYAQIMVVLVPLALDRVWNEKSLFLRLIAGWALAVCVLAVIFTFSRGGLLALGVVVFMLMAYRPPNVMAIIITILLAIPLLQFVPQSYVARASTLIDLVPGVNNTQASTEVSYRGRISEFLVGVYMFMDHPLVGVGADNYPNHYQDYSRQIGLDPRIEERHPHSLYVQIIAEQGLLGLFIFGYMLWIALSGLSKAQSDLYEIGLLQEGDMANALLIGFIGYLAAALFLHAAYPRFFWLLVGIALALPNVVENERAALKQAAS